MDNVDSTLKQREWYRLPNARTAFSASIDEPQPAHTPRSRPARRERVASTSSFLRNPLLMSLSPVLCSKQRGLVPQKQAFSQTNRRCASPHLCSNCRGLLLQRPQAQHRKLALKHRPNASNTLRSYATIGRRVVEACNHDCGGAALEAGSPGDFSARGTVRHAASSTHPADQALRFQLTCLDLAHAMVTWLFSYGIAQRLVCLIDPNK